MIYITIYLSIKEKIYSDKEWSTREF